MTERTSLQREQYRPTEKQISFFFTVNISKKSLKQGNRLSLDEAVVQYAQDQKSGVIAHNIKRNLGQSGGIVTDLQANEEHSWRLFRMQMNRAVQKVPYQLRHVERSDLVSDRLPKILTILRNMIPADQIETTENTLVLALEKQILLRGTYDFGTPFYGYVNRMVKNRLVDLLRKENRARKREVSVDEMESTIPATDLFVTKEKLIEAEQALAQEFDRLMEQIHQNLPDVKKKVILHTLSMRPQFWNLVEFLEISPPTDVPKKGQYDDDQALAKGLGMSITSIRSNRSQAKDKIAEAKPDLGWLIERLLAAR